MSTTGPATMTGGWASGELSVNAGCSSSSEAPVLGGSGAVNPPADEPSRGEACSVELSRAAIVVPARKVTATAATVIHAVRCVRGAARCRGRRRTVRWGVGAGCWTSRGSRTVCGLRIAGFRFDSGAVTWLAANRSTDVPGSETVRGTSSRCAAMSVSAAPRPAGLSGSPRNTMRALFQGSNFESEVDRGTERTAARIIAGPDRYRLVPQG